MMSMIRDNKIALVEIFKSIDGEAFHSGQPTVFVRTFGCCCRCSYCDSAYTFDEDKHFELYGDLIWMTAKEIFDEVESLEKGFTHKSICLTGGEPLMEENKDFMLNDFIPLFIENGYAVNVETCGAVDYKDYKDKFGEPSLLDGYGNRKGMTLIADWKLPSSKMNKKMIASNLSLYSPNDIVKMVVSDDVEDWEEVTRVCENTKAKIFLSPVFDKVEMKKIPEYVMSHPQFNITAQLQIHKFFWEPEKIGV